MDSIYAELTVVWLVAIAIGSVLAVYHTARALCDVVKNLVDGRRSKTARRTRPGGVPNHVQLEGMD